MRTGPPTPAEAAHLAALRITLRLKQWPADDSERRVLFWMRTLLDEHKRTRVAATKRARQKKIRRAIKELEAEQED